MNSTKFHSSNQWFALLVMLAFTTMCRAQEAAPEQPQPPKEPAATSNDTTDKAQDAEARPILMAHDIVRHANDAAKAVRTVKYRVHNQRIDVPESLSSITEGTVIMAGWNGSEPEKFRFDVHARPDPTAAATHTTVGTDGKDFWFMNHRDKRAQVGSDMASLGVYRLAVRYFPVYEFVLPDPFGDELTAPRVELAGVTEVNGERCYVIKIVYRSGMQEAFWYFSSKDFLPRRVDRRLEDPEAATLTRASTISDLEVNPTFEDDPYAFKAPEGYTVVDKRGE